MNAIRIRAALLALAFVAAASRAAAAAPAGSLNAALGADLKNYLAQHRASEHVSTASLAVSLHGKPAFEVAEGTTLYDGGAASTPATLFQIGSITKSFTAAAILQLEAQGKLSIEDPIGKWLPQYPQWSKITIHRLLDMTSGIVTYDNEQPMQRYWAAHPYHYFSPAALIAWVAGAPLEKGYYYSNTAYQLCDLIIEKASGKTYTQNVDAIVSDAGLDETYFNDDIYPKSIQARMAAGYFTNDEALNRGLFPLLGKDMRPFSTSWAQAAGGIVASPRDVVAWIRDLYTGPVLATQQRRELETLISTKTAEPIDGTNASEPRGFGLGVTQMTMAPLGTFWFYEGSTIGYRVAYVYSPKYDLVFAVALNSQPRTDEIGPLLAAIFTTLKEHGAL